MPPHCDSLDGPVVKAAATLLEARNVELVLPYLPAEGEAEVRQAFEQTLQVEPLSADAKQLADEWFFENVVRIHRAGEGAPYTGSNRRDSATDPSSPSRSTRSRLARPTSSLSS